MIDVKSHKTGIFGIQESGKTYFAQNLAKYFDNPLIFVVNKDDVKGWTDIPRSHVYVVNDRKNIYSEFPKFIEFAHKNAEQGRVDAIFIDEADMFFNNNYTLDPTTLDLVVNHRHINNGNGVALIFITRRPQDIPTKIVESCKYLFVFKLEGSNAIQRFKEINPLIPPLIEKIEFKKHNFVVKEIGKDPYIHKAI